MAENLTSLTDEALTHRLFQVERELVSARFQHSMGTLENTAALGLMRKSIARIRTEARRRELAQGLPKDGLVRMHRSTFTAGDDAASADTAEESGGFLQGIVDKLTGNE